MRRSSLLLALAASPVFAQDLTSTRLENTTAYIPSQCYTKTEDVQGHIHNPCFTCHVQSRAPHYINDQDLQTEYSFPGPALKNPWTNLFVDRSAAIAAADPDELLSYIRRSNYRDTQGRNLLQARLDDLPEGWDANGNGQWDGFVPDIAFSFDDEGFDIGPDRQMTGWRAFAYQPLPGTFWPANGSTDDVMIRLPEAYRQNALGHPSRAVYKANLAITEALLKRADVQIMPLDEAEIGLDIDMNGQIGTASTVRFAFAPLDGVTMHYAGRAGQLQDEGKAPLAAGLYPEGTEFLHTVRYLDPVGGVTLAPRLKELRYMVKTRWQTYFDRQEGALAEGKERVAFPDRIAMFFGDVETGISNGTGWRLQAFIEDAKGDLRPQTFEETVFCMGCHGGIGVNDDDTFAFPRKLDHSAFREGWYHWSQKGLEGTPERKRADGRGEYAHYLTVNGAGDELRGNSEIIEAWLDENGALPPARAQALAQDIAPLLTPSRERAMSLNAAYREIVREQSFTKGRDATVTPQSSVHQEVEQGQTTGITDVERAWYATGR